MGWFNGKLPEALSSQRFKKYLVEGVDIVDSTVF
jgi:hypothetical protein